MSGTRLKRPPALLALIATLLGGMLVAVAPAPPASADIHRPLKGEFFDIAVDEAHGHLFLSRGRATDGLLVTDLKGRTVKVMRDLGGTTGMVFSPDRSQLYVGLHNDHAIAIVDTDALTVDKRPLPRWVDDADFVPQDTVPACPLDLEWLDGAVWFVDQCFTPRHSNWGRLRSYTPTTGRTTITPGYIYYPEIVADADSRTLFFSSDDGMVRAYDVGPAPNRILSTRASFDWADSASGIPQECTEQWWPGQFSIVPNSPWVMAAMGFYLNRDDLTYAGTFPCEHGTGRDAIAFRPDGMTALAAIGTWLREPEIEIVRPGDRTALRAYRFRSRVVSSYYAVEWGKRRLYAVAWSSYRREESARLRVITPRPASFLSISTRERRYRSGRVVRVNFRFTGAPTPPHSARIHNWHDGDEFTRRVRLDDSGRGVFRFRIRDTANFEAWIVDDGDVVYSNPLVIRVRRGSG